MKPIHLTLKQTQISLKVSCGLCTRASENAMGDIDACWKRGGFTPEKLRDFSRVVFSIYLPVGTAVGFDKIRDK